MSSHDGLGGVVGGEQELSSGFDLFDLPTSSNEIISSRDIEIRLFTVLDRFERVS